MDNRTVASELAARGYCVVPGFLREEDVSEELLSYLAGAQKFSDGVISQIPAAIMAGIQKKIEAFIPEIAALLGLSIHGERYGYCAIRINEANGPAMLKQPFDVHRDPKIAPGGVLNWHLDHFSYYLYRDHRNWLICYMPVVKPSRQLANLAIIPSDVLEERDPKLAQAVRGRGAMRFRCVEIDTMSWFKMRFPDQKIQVGDWFAIDDLDDSTMGWKIDADLEECKVVPELETKDLLIMRADVIHRTNDAGSDRISVRCDAIPREAPDLETLPGLLRLTAGMLFTGAKRRYNLRNWVRRSWRKRLRGDAG